MNSMVSSRILAFVSIEVAATLSRQLGKSLSVGTNSVTLGTTMGVSRFHMAGDGTRKNNLKRPRHGHRNDSASKNGRETRFAVSETLRSLGKE